MIDYAVLVLFMAIVGMIAMTLTIRLNWEVTFWRKINKKISSSWNGAIWILGSVCVQLFIQLIAERFTDDTMIIHAVKGAAIGITFVLLPSISSYKEKKANGRH